MTHVTATNYLVTAVLSTIPDFYYTQSAITSIYTFSLLHFCYYRIAAMYFVVVCKLGYYFALLIGETHAHTHTLTLFLHTA